MTLASFGKMPTTRARRLISRLIRSNGFHGPDLRPVTAGESGEGEDLDLRDIHQRSDLGKGQRQLVADLVPPPGRGSGVGLGERGPKHRRHHFLVELRHQRQQVAGEVDAAALMPHPFEATSEGRDEAGVLVGDDEPNTVQPALFQGAEEPRQNTSSLESPTSRPRISRPPSAVTAVATTTAMG